MNPAVQLAVDVAATRGIHSSNPQLLQESNNVVVWLKPHPVIAKVGVHGDSATVLDHEYRVATALAHRQAAIAIPRFSTIDHPGFAQSGTCVTLWERLETTPGEITPTDAGVSLRQLHRDLAAIQLPLPSIRKNLERAASLLPHDHFLQALTPDDRTFLRRTWAALSQKYDEASPREVPIHGEPHEGNRILTADGLCWIDFEDACLGPVEWDVSFLPEAAHAAFPDLDPGLLHLVTLVDAARRAIFASVQARFPDMHAFALDRLAFLRSHSLS